MCIATNGQMQVPLSAEDVTRLADTAPCPYVPDHVIIRGPNLYDCTSVEQQYSA